MVTPSEGERGSVLVISLAMVVLFTLVGATFLTLATTEGRISTNQKADVQALFLAESGAQVAYKELAANNYQGWTHEPDGTIASQVLQPVSFAGSLVWDGPGTEGLHDERDDGWLVWEWAPGDSGSGLTRSGLPESFRFAVRRASSDPSDTQFVIDVEGAVGHWRQRLQILGYSEPAFTYALFSNGPLSEFTRGEDQHVEGKIHANGDMYFRPWDPRKLTIDAPSVTATGRMIRTTDIFGRDLFTGSTVKIKNASGNYVEMELGAPGVAMDSDNPDWINDDPTDGVDGALELWDGIVRDGQLGAVSVDPPPVETIAPGGWYDQRASIRIHAGDRQSDQSGADLSGALGDAVREVSFWNAAIGEDVTVQELDVERLVADGNFPPNGLIFSEVPLRIVNGENLQGDLTIVASHSVYTKGDFNSENKRAAAIISAGRIWHLSDSWSDDEAFTKGDRTVRQATNGSTTINAALIDSQPAVGTAHYADLDGDGERDDPNAGDANANADSLLETWGNSRRLRKTGSIVHLQNADMADNIYNTGKRDEEISWVRWTAYTPPRREYKYDSALQGAAGQPPFTFMVGKVFLWQEIGS
jgi:hypothetical protein